jgi:hypothetical protein
MNRRSSLGPAAAFLDEATWDTRLAATAFNLKRAVQDLSRFTRASVRTGKTGVRGTFVTAGLASFHGHYTILKRDRDEVYLQLQIARGALTKAEGLPTVADFVGVIRNCMTTPPAEVGALVGGTFLFPLKSWQPTLTLPFEAGTALDGLPGKPRISGVDFAFAETSDDQPLLRAFITTYDTLGEFSVRILVRTRLALDDSIHKAVLDAALGPISTFAVRTKRKETSVR